MDELISIVLVPKGKRLDITVDKITYSIFYNKSDKLWEIYIADKLNFWTAHFMTLSALFKAFPEIEQAIKKKQFEEELEKMLK